MHELWSPGDDRQGWCLLISTPKGIANWFFDMHTRAKTDDDWATWQSPTSANPLIPESEIKQARGQLDAHTFAQEFLAQFVTAAGSRIKAEWFRRYTTRGDHYLLHDADGTARRTLEKERCLRITTVDPAGSSRDVQRERRGKAISYSAIGTFDVDRQEGSLVVVEMQRLRVEIPDLCNAIARTHERLRPAYVGIENQGIGLGVFQQMNRTPVPVRALKPKGKDKVSRSTTALVKFEQGKIYFPRTAPWLKDFEDELLLWSGADDDVADQVDVLAYAAMEVGSQSEFTPRREADGTITW